MIREPGWRWLGSVLAAVLFLGSTAIPAGQLPIVPNGDFTAGEDHPLHWLLVGAGDWIDRDVLEVHGSGDDSSFWRCDEISFLPRSHYRFRMRVRRAGGSGSAISGPTFANRDQAGLTDAWQEIGHVFRTPDSPSGYLRLGQWHATGKIQFDWAKVTRVLPVYRWFGDVVLGEGEMIRDGQYQFQGDFRHEASNDHRTLDSVAAGFNSDRWTFVEGQFVIYRFALPNCRFTGGEVQFNVNYHTRGTCIAEVSSDRQTWYTVTRADGVKTVDERLPADLFPAKVIYLRLRAAGPSNFQVNRIGLRAPIDGPSLTAVGETLYADLNQRTTRHSLRELGLVADPKTGSDVLRGSIHGEMPLQAVAFWTKTNGRKTALPVDLASGAGELVFQVSIPADVQDGDRIQIRLPARDGSVTAASLRLRVPELCRSDYGERLAAAPQGLGLWWCDATRKVSRRRPLPETAGQAARLEAARGDWEAAQIIVHPNRTLKGLMATASNLSGPGGAVIPADRIRVLRVFYHFVHHPTDYTGVRDWWPDALPPLDSPIDVPAGQNQPLWILVHVPRDAAAGNYQGEISLRSESLSTRVPIRVHVWNFSLPERNHLETNYGLSLGNIFRYHNLKKEADKRRVLDLYLQCFAEHRISPYDPVPLDPPRVEFHTDRTPPTVELDFFRFDAAMERALRLYHFTGYRLPVHGMGGGTFHQRWQPKIGPFTEDTEEYQMLFSRYVGELERHLRDKGWRDVAYVYWFDEPAPRDYEFVANGMKRLQRYAPGLRRMLTEQPGDNPLAGLVDIWCPVSHNYDHTEAEKCRQRGERFWWYVCTSPKAPYCTLFIDHPATELRVWHWQTWQRDIVGTLVWQSNYWTSSAAFPDTAQNPYEDPMGYVSGYSTPRGAKRYWGNGDGRFIYPPLTAAAPGPSDSAPILDAPVSSIRWEMIREGVEDYEYLYRLRELVQRHRNKLSRSQIAAYEELLAVPESITKNMTTFTTDSTPIYDRRRAIAEAIERLTAQE